MKPDGIAALPNYLRFRVQLSKWFTEQVSTNIPFYRWGHLDTDFPEVTEQTHSTARTGFPSPEHWEGRGRLGLLRSTYEPLLLRVLCAMPCNCTYDSSTPADLAAVRFLPDQDLKDTLSHAPDE